MSDRKNYIRLDGEIIARNHKYDNSLTYFNDGYAVHRRHNTLNNYWCIYNFAGDLLISRRFNSYKTEINIQSNHDYLIMVEKITVCVYSRRLLRRMVSMFADPPPPLFKINIGKILPKIIYSIEVALVDDYFYAIATATDDKTIILKYNYAGQLIEMNTIDGNDWYAMNHGDTVILYDKTSDDRDIICEIRNIELSGNNDYFYHIDTRNRSTSLLSQFYPGNISNLKIECNCPRKCATDDLHRNDYILVKKRNGKKIKDGTVRDKVEGHKPYFPKLLLACDILYMSDRMIYDADIKDSVVKRYILPEECFGKI